MLLTGKIFVCHCHVGSSLCASLGGLESTSRQSRCEEEMSRKTSEPVAAERADRSDSSATWHPLFRVLRCRDVTRFASCPRRPGTRASEGRCRHGAYFGAW